MTAEVILQYSVGLYLAFHDRLEIFVLID